jgi:hypothetical protein
MTKKQTANQLGLEPASFTAHTLSPKAKACTRFGFFATPSRAFDPVFIEDLAGPDATKARMVRKELDLAPSNLVGWDTPKWREI